MNNYQRLEINLLPPEMAPSPAVRGSSILIAIILIALVLFVGFDAGLSLSHIAALEATKKQQEKKITLAKPEEDTYQALKDIADHTEGRGKLVGLASSTYVEYPLVMDRVSRLLPDGVYLVRAGSAGSSRGGSELDLEFKTATADPTLIPRTLEAFKSSSFFSDVILHSGDFEQHPLDELKKSFDIGYGYESPESGNFQSVAGYDFEIRAYVNNPVQVDDLPTVMDNSDYMTQFTLTSDPNAVPAPKAAGAVAGAPPAGGDAGGAAAATPPAAAGGAAPAAGGAGAPAGGSK